MKTLLLLSGGLDSAVCGAICRDRGDEIHAVTYNYGQNHAVEIEYACRVGSWLGVASHEHVDIVQFGMLSRSALTSHPESIPKDVPSAGVAPTFVPARNLLFLSFALGIADGKGCDAVCTGVNAVDYSGYPDCRPEFVDSFRQTSSLAMVRQIRIETPLINMSKREIVALSRRFDIPDTMSCYDPAGETPCGRCDSCLIRQGAADVPS